MPAPNVQTLLFLLFLLICERLLREDYLHRSVYRRDSAGLLLCGLGLRLAALCADAQNLWATAGRLLAELLGALLLALPLLWLYLLRRQPGSADLKYIWLCFFLLEVGPAFCSLLAACVWACAAESWKRRSVCRAREACRVRAAGAGTGTSGASGMSASACPARAAPEAFALLPYLILSTLPALALRYLGQA